MTSTKSVKWSQRPLSQFDINFYVKIHISWLLEFSRRCGEMCTWYIFKIFYRVFWTPSENRLIRFSRGISWKNHPYDCQVSNSMPIYFKGYRTHFFRGQLQKLPKLSMESKMRIVILAIQQWRQLWSCLLLSKPPVNSTRGNIKHEISAVCRLEFTKF